MIDIRGIDKAILVAGLFNQSKPLGMGFFHPGHRLQMTKEKAQAYLDEGMKYFDYLEGRVIKADVSGDTLNPASYDSQNGEGAALRVVRAIREGKAVEFKEALVVSAAELDAAIRVESIKF